MAFAFSPKRSLCLTLCLMASLTLSSSLLAREWSPTRSIQYIAPANPGGGWDTLVRTTARVIQQESLTNRNLAPINIPGGGGAVAWAQIARDRGNPHKLFAASPPLILVPLMGTSRYGYEDFTPVARLITDYHVVLVRANSEYQNINDLMDALKVNPGLSVGGGSAPGSMDHISIASLASTAGLQASSINYIPFSGGGEAMVSLLGGHVEAAITSAGAAMGQLGEGSELRALGISAPQRQVGPLANVPTYQEQGIDYTFDVWRGIMAPPGMPAEAVAFYEQLFARMLQTEGWAQARDQLGWIDAYQDSETFAAFLAEQHAAFSGILTELGLRR